MLMRQETDTLRKFPPEPTDKSKSKTLPNCKSCLNKKGLTDVERKRMDEEKPSNKTILIALYVEDRPLLV